MHQPKPKRRWKRYLALVLLLLLGYGTYRAVRPDPDLKKVKQLQAQFASAEAKAWTPEQRSEKGRELRDAMGKLSESQRQAMGDERRQGFQRDLEAYARMTPAEKTRHLDEQINRGEQRRQQAGQRNPGGTGGPGTFGAGPRPGGSSSVEDRQRRRKERLDRTTPEFRALTDQYRKDLEARRRQRGLPAAGGR